MQNILVSQALDEFHPTYPHSPLRGRASLHSWLPWGRPTYGTRWHTQWQYHHRNEDPGSTTHLFSVAHHFLSPEKLDVDEVHSTWRRRVSFGCTLEWDPYLDKWSLKIKHRCSKEVI